jgi:hypothetical protein
MVLNKDFSEFIELLNAKDVKYLVIGGYAVAYHGYPRYTKDLDIWVWLDPVNAEKVTEALAAFGMGGLNFSASDFLNVNNVIQIGLPPNRIDLLTDLEGLDFETCFANREIVRSGDISVNFLDFDHLVASKMAAGRPQDRVDVKKLRERKTKNK